MRSNTALALESINSTCPLMGGQVETPLEMIARGVDGGVEACVEAYGSLVASLAHRLLRHESEVDDAVQEIFIELWKTAQRFDPERASDRGFVAMIARRRLIDRIRKQDRRPKTVEIPEGMEFGTDEHRLTEVRAANGPVLRALERLAEDRRQYVVLSVIHGFSHSQIAERLDVPIGTVKSGIRRGLHSMRSYLSDQEGMGGAHD